MAYKVELDFGSGYVDYSAYLYLALPTDKPVKRKRSIYNNFRPVVSTCQIQFVRNTPLVNAFLTASQDVACKVTNGSTPYFQGYIRPTVKAQLTAAYGLNALTIEAVDAWYRLDKTAIANAVYLSIQVSKPTDPATSLLHLLFTAAGFDASELNLAEITATVPALNVQSYSDKYRDIIEGVLEECGYSAYVDASGVVQLYNLGPVSITPSVTMATGVGGNIAEQLNIERQEAAKEAVDVEYSDAKILAGAKVFEDTTGGTNASPCNISLDAGEYYPNGAALGKSVKGKMGIDGQELIAVYGLTPTINASGVATQEFVQSGMDIAMRLYSATGGTITTLAGYANAVVAGDIKKVIREFVVNTEKRESFTMKYLRDETSAQRLAIIRARRYQHGAFVWSMKTTQLDLTPGDYVAMNESAILGATSTLRVISVEDSQDPKTITITAEGVAAYEADATSTESEIVLQDPLSAEQESQVTAVISGVLIAQTGQAPANVLSINAKAYEGYIQLTWPEPSGSTISDNPVGYILQRSVDSGTTWKDIAGTTNGTARVQGSTYYWDFNRATDGYPEKTDNKGWIPLSSYRFRVKAVNAAGVASAGWATDSSVDTTAYKSWMPTVPVASGSTSMRTASLSWTDELAAYGRLRFEGQISIDNTNWFQPAVGLDASGAETNWRQSATANLFNAFSMPQYTQMLPLSGQIAGNPVDTTYYFRFRTVLDCPWTGSEGVGADSGGKRASAWSSAVTVLAKANGAYDLVSGAIVNQLKADSAGLVGMWTSDVNNPGVARDISGGGKHLTVVGTTPTSDGGFQRDGVNDYEKTQDVVSMPDVFHYHEELEIPNHATQLQIIVGISINTTSGRLLITRVGNSTSLVLYYYNGSASTTLTVPNYFASDATKIVSDITITWATGALAVSKNGLPFYAGTLTGAVKPADMVWYFGNQSVLAGTQYCGGKVKGRRIYSRALTDAEVLALYQNPNTGLPGTIIAERIFTQNLAAIQGLFASVAGGGDDELNYWNLSSVPQGARPVGSFRAGNAEVYIYTNPNAAGTVADPRILLMSKGATPGDDDYIAITDTGIVMSDTLMAKVGASSATIDAIFTQAIEVGDGGYSYYFAGSGATRKAIRVGSNEIAWGTYPIGGLFTPSNIITQPTTDKHATLAGDFRTPVKTGSYSYAESSLSVTASSKSALLVLRNKTWLLAYPTSNGVVYTNTRVNGVWGTPTNAIGISAYYMCLRELPNGNVILVYSKYTDRKLYCKIYDGTTWGDELLIEDTPVYDVSVEIAQNGDATVIYNKVTPNSGLYATLGTASSSYTTWTVEATPLFSDGSIVDLTTQINTEGVICIVFSYNVPGYKIVRILGKYGSGWSAPATIINSPDYTNLSLVNFLDGQLGLICKNTSHYPCLFKTVLGSWSVVNVLTNVQRWFMDFTFNQATNTIEGVCVDGSGNLYEVSISDTANCRIGAGIIESGVAPDGSRWQKTSDGMLECWGYIASISHGAKITFPAEFNATPPSIEPHAGPSPATNTYDFIQAYTATATSFYITYKDAVGNSIANRPMNWRAKGLAKV